MVIFRNGKFVLCEEGISLYPEQEKKTFRCRKQLKHVCRIAYTCLQVVEIQHGTPSKSRDEPIHSGDIKFTFISLIGYAGLSGSFIFVTLTACHQFLLR